ncbi:MAG: nucleoside hydrolase [Clostridia bacterium]
MKILKILGMTVLILLLCIIIAALGFFAYMTLAQGKSKQFSEEAYQVARDDKIKVILDCDNTLGSFWEVDDGLVLSYILNKPEADLLGITTTFGNRTYDHKYTVRMLKKADRTDIPLFKGEQASDDGVTDAARFLAETVAKYPGEVTIIAAGPVGNLEAASQVDPEFFNNVGQIIVMGGYTEDLSLGNRDVPELNLSADYMASHAMINSGARVTVMTGQACLDAPFYFKDFPKLGNFPLYWKFQSVFWTVLNKAGTGNDYFIMWDMLPAVYAFHPEYFEDNFVYVSSTAGDLQRGMLRLSEDESGVLINIPAGIEDKDGFYRDVFINLNRQGK